ncbi:MAG: ROK family protein [Gammaproteobacteria bacterium]|nr:ROK family protein [Gammaproteobacteria bacterium]
MTGLRIGIDFGGTKIEAVLMNATGEVVHRERRSAPQGDYEMTLSALCRLVHDLDARTGGPCPVGIGTPGAWVEQRHVLKNCNATWLNGKPLLDDLVGRLGPRVRIANDANCFALSEARDGAGRGANVVFGVILGTGVGGGIVVNGSLLEGANAVGGEWGHTPMPYRRADWVIEPRLRECEARLASRTCYCGRVDCIETWISGPALAATYEELEGVARTPEEVAMLETPAMDLYFAMLARALAQIVNIVDPDVIVLGGGVSNIPGIYERVPELMSRYGFTHEGATLLRPAQFGDASGVLGAARLHG